MQTGSVWGFLPWYRFKQTMSFFSGTGLFYYIFAVLELIFFKDSKHISSIYMTFWYLHHSNTIGSNVFHLNLFFSKSTYIIFIFKIFLCHVHRVYVFDFTLSILLQELYIYYCDMFSNHVFSLCHLETRCSWKGYHLKKYPPETGSSWKGHNLKNCPPEPGNSWKNTICKNVSLKYAPPWNGFCLWSCFAVKYYKSPGT